MVLSQLEAGNPDGLACKRFGAPLLFGRLWEETGCRAVIESLLTGRAFEFPVERAVFATVLHRIMVSGSDRACEKWIADYGISGVDGLALHHLYRAMAWLGEELPPEQQAGGDTDRAAHGQGPDRGAAVRPAARSVQRTLRRLHGHHLPQFHRRGRREPGRTRLLEGSPAR